jgi:arylsulfatase A
MFHFGRTLSFLISALLLPTIGRAADSPPPLNVVLIVADDLGWADLGCYGSRYHRTPHLDRLAAQGVRFTDGYAACPVCSPTRASIMTGKYPARLNLTDWLPGRADRPDQKLLRPIINQRLPHNEPTLAEELKKAGYVTGHIGKWHLGGRESLPQDHGFDVNIAGDHTGTPLSYFAPFERKGRFMPGLEKAPEGEYLTDRLTTEAEKFLDLHKDKPFFLYLPHYTVHIPMRAKQELIAKYQPGKPGEQGNPIYAAMLESLDDSVGRVLKKLDDLKLTERTLVIFTSDNGGLCVTEGPNTPPTINAPLREGKGYLYEGGIRVPLIVKWPGVVKAGTDATPVCSIDFFPTILEACGVKSDAKPDGVSLVPLLKGGKLEREALYWHYPHYSNQGGKPGGAVRRGPLKLLYFYEGRFEMYDLARDVRESQNIALDQEKKTETGELFGMLTRWRTAVGAKMPEENPNYLPNPQNKDGAIVLHARIAEVRGKQLRFEPLPHKNTLGFWTHVEDWALWEFTVTKPGKFTVEVLQGCGKDQGGSEVEVIVNDQKLGFTVEDTGHFQNFKARQIGTLTIDKPGRHTLEVRPKKKAAAAVMDLRTVTLRPVADR